MGLPDGEGKRYADSYRRNKRGTEVDNAKEPFHLGTSKKPMSFVASLIGVKSSFLLAQLPDQLGAP